MTREQIMRMLDGFRADMEKVMLEPGNMSKEPQFEDLRPEQISPRLSHFALSTAYSVESGMESPSEIQRRCLHVANYAMMIHWHAEQRRLEERGRTFICDCCNQVRPIEQQQTLVEDADICEACHKDLVANDPAYRESAERGKES